MDDQFQMLDELEHWRAILASYQENQPILSTPQEASPVEGEEPTAAEPEKPWVNRITELEGIEPEELSRLHGQLIALGYLEFDLVSRSDGIGYLLSRQGKKALNRPEIPDAA